MSSGGYERDFRPPPPPSTRTAPFCVFIQRVVVILTDVSGQHCFVITQKSGVLSGGCVCLPSLPPHCSCPLSDYLNNFQWAVETTQTVRQFSPPTVTPSSLAASVFLNTLPCGVQDSVSPLMCPSHEESAFCPGSTSMRLLRFAPVTAIISLYSINRFLFVMEVRFAYREI